TASRPTPIRRGCSPGTSTAVPRVRSWCTANPRRCAASPAACRIPAWKCRRSIRNSTYEAIRTVSPAGLDAARPRPMTGEEQPPVSATATTVAPANNEPAWAGWSDEQLLDVRLRDLDLRIEGTDLHAHIEQLYQELEEHGVRFRPHFWISDEWFTPDGV